MDCGHLSSIIIHAFTTLVEVPPFLSLTPLPRLPLPFFLSSHTRALPGDSLAITASFTRYTAGCTNQYPFLTFSQPTYIDDNNL